ncbi:MAG: EamA family transporter [Chloroflexi bacterium]|nr:EamA family transporter [Chloroflexota bacterium]
MPVGSNKSLNWRVIGAFAAIYLLWGSTYLGIRFALETLPPFLTAGVRFIFAGAILYGLARQQGAPAPTLAQWRSAVVLGFVLFMLNNGLLMWSQTRVPSGMAALLIATVPLWMVLTGWLVFRGKRPGGQVFAGLFTGLIGIMLLVRPDQTGAQVDPLGALVLIFAAFAWSFGSLLSRRLDTPSSPLLGAGMNLMAGSVILIIASAITGEWAALNLAAVSLKSVLAVVYLAVFGSIIGFGSYMWLLANVPSDRVATYAYVNPVVAVFLGWAFAGEPLTPQTLVAAAIIVTAVILITTARPQAAQRQTLTFQLGLRLKALAVRALR